MHESVKISYTECMNIAWILYEKRQISWTKNLVVIMNFILSEETSGASTMGEV